MLLSDGNYEREENEVGKDGDESVIRYCLQQINSVLSLNSYKIQIVSYLSTYLKRANQKLSHKAARLLDHVTVMDRQRLEQNYTRKIIYFYKGNALVPRVLSLSSKRESLRIMLANFLPRPYILGSFQRHPYTTTRNKPKSVPDNTFMPDKIDSPS